MDGDKDKGPHVLKIGYMHKRSSKLRAWLKRWFVLLDDGVLLYFKSHEDWGRKKDEPHGRIPVTNYRRVGIEMDDTRPFGWYLDGGKNADTDKPHLFFAESNEDRREWVALVAEAGHLEKGPLAHEGGGEALSRFGRLLKSGYMTRHSGKMRKKTQSLFCVLQEHIFFCYKSHMDWGQCAAVISVPVPDCKRIVLMPKISHAFAIETRAKNYKFAAESEAELHSWLEALAQTTIEQSSDVAALKIRDTVGAALSFSEHRRRVSLSERSVPKMFDASTPGTPSNPSRGARPPFATTLSTGTLPGTPSPLGIVQEESVRFAATVTAATPTRPPLAPSSSASRSGHRRSKSSGAACQRGTASTSSTSPLSYSSSSGDEAGGPATPRRPLPKSPLEAGDSRRNRDKRLSLHLEKVRWAGSEIPAVPLDRSLPQPLALNTKAVDPGVSSPRRSSAQASPPTTPPMEKRHRHHRRESDACSSPRDARTSPRDFPETASPRTAVLASSPLATPPTPSNELPMGPPQRRDSAAPGDAHDELERHRRHHRSPPSPASPPTAPAVTVPEVSSPRSPPTEHHHDHHHDHHGHRRHRRKPSQDTPPAPIVAEPSSPATPRALPPLPPQATAPVVVDVAAAQRLVSAPGGTGERRRHHHHHHTPRRAGDDDSHDRNDRDDLPLPPPGHDSPRVRRHHHHRRVDEDDDDLGPHPAREALESPGTPRSPTGQGTPSPTGPGTPRSPTTAREGGTPRARDGSASPRSPTGRRRRRKEKHDN